jgi:hypothetical protein
VKALVLLHAASTLVMVGVILVVQLVHYPLFALASDAFPAYESAHAQRISWIVVPVMLVELATALALVAYRPDAWPGWAPWLGLALIAVIWATTALASVPAHGALAERWNAAAHARLVSTNWIRTVAWGLRGELVVWLLGRAL